MNTAVGKPTDRVDGRLKVTGQARYAAEYPVENVAHAYLVQSTVSKGRITNLDTREAEAAPGVLAVLTHRNAPAMKETDVFDPASQAPKSASTSVNVLQTDRVWWHGQ